MLSNRLGSIIKDRVRTDAAHKGFVSGRGGGSHPERERFGELDRIDTYGSRSSVDENRLLVVGSWCGRVRERTCGIVSPQTEGLGRRRCSEWEGCSFFPAEFGGLEDDVGLREGGVLSECTLTGGVLEGCSVGTG